MDFANSLTQAFGGQPNQTSTRPNNLSELLRTLQLAPTSSVEYRQQLVGWIQHFAKFSEGVLASNLNELGKVRGILEALLSDQSEIYGDIVTILRGAIASIQNSNWPVFQQQSQQFAVLLEELKGNLEDLNAWKQSNFHRCLHCGYGAPDQAHGRCPECQVSLLRPPKATPVTTSTRVLAGAEAALQASVQDVLAGRKDVSVLRPFVEELLDFYSTCLVEIGTPDPEFEEDIELEEALQSSVESLYLMADAFNDFDAQNLVDGWQLFFLSSSTVEQLMEYDDQPVAKPSPQSLDQVILSGEED